MKPHSRLTQLLVFFLALVPPCLLAVLIFKYSVDLPQWDQWTFVSFFEKFSRGSLTFGDLFAQVNEYREFFPNLVFVALGWLTHWDVRYEMLVTFLVACFISLNVYRLAERTIEGSRTTRLLLFLIANLVIFSPSQYENWLQGQQLIYYVPIACVTTCLVVAYSSLNTKTRFLVCGCLSIVSTFSSANGILCWLIVLPALMLAESSKASAHKRWLVVGWIAGLLSSAALYLYDYHKPAWSNPLSTAFFHPMRAIIYFLCFLGAPVALGQVKAAAVAGIVLVSAFGLSCAYLFKCRANLPLMRRMSIWVTVGAYSVLTAAMTTIGRLGFGTEQSQNTRYVGYSAYLVVGLIFLVGMITRDVSSKNDSPRQTVWLRRATFVLAGVLISLQPFIFVLFVNRMAEMRTMLLQAKASVLFINLKPDTLLLTTLYPDLDRLTKEANDLNRLGFLRPGLIKTRRLAELADPGQSNPSEYGSWDHLDRSEDNGYFASGRSTLPYRGELADAIILAYQAPDGETLMFRLTRPQENRNGGWYRKREPSGNWQAWFSADELPPLPVTLTAWGFDANTGKAFRLNGSFELPGSQSLGK